jgi:glycosyltransferase involved in cell wall biosynthesis
MDEQIKTRRTPMRLMYAAGPGDIIGTFRHWLADRDDPGQVAMTYSGQFYDVCRRLGSLGFAISSHNRREEMAQSQFRVVHRGAPLQRTSGALYHVGQLWSAMRLMLDAILYRADAVVVCEGTCHWFPLRALPILGISVIPTIHCVLWRKTTSGRGRPQSIIDHLDRPFWCKSVACILSASSDITEQLSVLTNHNHRPIIEFLPTYRRGTFADAAGSPIPRVPFRVLFAGRVEPNKGVFDLLEIAGRLAVMGRSDIEFDLCGTGTAIAALAERARQMTADGFRLHGHCDRTKMREMFDRCHVVVVPTTSDFVEGFNQVVVEGVLAGKPVITSDICPALKYVREAVVEVAVDDVDAYQAAILKLADDQELYERKRAGCRQHQEQFYDQSRGWAAALEKALQFVRTGGVPVVS